MKPRDILMGDETLFRDENVFSPGYLPPDYMHRDSQLQEIMLSLKPGLRGTSPVNTFIYGPPGTGKTTAVKHAFNELAEASKKIVPIYVNCEDFSTPYSIFARIYETVYGISAPSTGKPLEEVKERIYTRLKKENRCLVVALDEIDRLAAERNIDQVLVDLLKAHSTYGYDKVGVIGITIDENVPARLDEKSRSVYNPNRIFFQKYKKDEIRDILGNRARCGFYDGVLKDDLLDYIVERTYEAGDMRAGIELMRRSALLAEKDASREIKKEHAQSAYGALAGQKKEETAAVLTEDEKFLLDLVTKDSGQMSGFFYERFREQTGAGVKRYNETIALLEKRGLIKTEYKEGIRGRSREISIV